MAFTFDSPVSFGKNTHQLFTGTGTAGQAGSSSAAYVPALWTFNLGLTPAAGDIIVIKIPVAGVNAGVWLSVDNGTTYYPVALVNDTRLTNQYAVNNVVALIFQTSMATKIYGTTKAGAAAGASVASQTISRWCLLNGYDSNTTYSEISTTNLRNSSGSSAGLITGRRLYDALTNNLKASSGDVQLYGAHLTGQVPAPTAANNGKILRIVSGVWTIQDVSVLVDVFYPVGSVYASTSTTAPTFGGTWTEIKVTATWDQLAAGERSYTRGTGNGTLHYWLRTA